MQHLVSEVSGVLRPGKTRFDAFRSIFPAGTVSGAPKVRAMQLIAELEREKRGVYAGAVGYFGYSSVEGDSIIEGAMDVSAVGRFVHALMLISADVHCIADHARQGWNRLSAGRWRHSVRFRSAR